MKVISKKDYENKRREIFRKHKTYPRIDLFYHNLIWQNCELCNELEKFDSSVMVFEVPENEDILI